jgi:hypothetical protein
MSSMPTYFDSSHPHFSKFSLINKNTISLNSNGTWYHITSPNKINETFNTFTYKVIKTTTDNYIMYGIGSNQLKNNQTNQQYNAEFIGYNGYDNGYVYD